MLLNKDLTFVAHRSRDGISLQPENSIQSYIDCIENPLIGGIEIDIQQTKDGIFVLMNYKSLENVTSLLDLSKNKISDYTYEELEKMSFHANFSEIEKAIITDATEFGKDSKFMLKSYEKLKQKLNVVTIPKLESILEIPRKGKKIFIEIKTDYSKEEKNI